MYNKQDLLHDLHKLRISNFGTLLVHSSMKSIGAVDGGAETVLDALSEYMKDGLLVLPTHTWSYINAENPNFYVDESPSCVGILTELFRKRPGVVRSLHPTHSVAALGEDASDFIAGNEQFDTPCARGSSWGKLLDRKATILLIGVDLRRNTYIHGVEEWLDIPNRLTDDHEQLYTVLRDGTKITVPSRRHIGHTSEKYERVDQLFQETGAMYLGKFGDATVRVCNTEKMTEVLLSVLKKNPHIFS
ncbi:AAC(3) family N-acetyltransferase [Bacillus kwashiorkori]|uniref:AAC(3) family N-acetyltransferase n=1 Tax=Bacillus kwashiorkori TaxID=1522318 RepID=UPI000784C288|nr:AAC(3) family N-acetyltransferase [Bacillus kwashiorkori]